MYSYKYGAIGEAVRAKIDNYKQRVRGGSSNSDSFGDVLKTYLNKTDSQKKAVSATGGNASKSLNGSTILYALQNSDTDTTANAVLSALGFYSDGNGGVGDLRNEADSLSDSAETLIKANASGGDTAIAVTEFVSDYNKLMTMLNVEGSSSAYLYKNAFSAMLSASEEQLTLAGITSENGLISYSGAGTAIPDAFLSNVASSAALISSYASSVAAEEDINNGVSDYYSALMNTMI